MKITQIETNISGFNQNIYALDEEGNFYFVEYNDNEDRYDFIKQEIKIIDHE